MGLLWSILGYEDESQIDPVTGLSIREKKLIRSTKEPLMKNVCETGAAILHEFFVRHPSYQDFFPFKGVPLSGIKTNKKFLAHCNSVMYAISSWIDSLDDPELLIAMLKKLGSNHARHKLPQQSFWDLREVILDCIKPLFPEETRNAFKKFLDLAINESLSGDS
ncbi:hypothetical protein WA026_019714 [Henosepilachna vigintioctopunctata]|uniref:Globin domain-containing protein n=1 Tax=Henosepilachna vigintioctopunctata TaxID=420089 RepID=A0AAW1UNV3_9CUCU